jgi:hypothetical protein
VKAQPIRVADVLVIGPLMVWGGARAIPERPFAGLALTLLGLGTISYNAVNYTRVRRMR